MKSLVALGIVAGSLLGASLAIAQAPVEPAVQPQPAPPPAQTAESAPPPSAEPVPAPAEPAPAPAVAPAPAAAPAPAPPPPVFAPPPPPPAVDRAPEESTARQHQGFYFAARVGPSYFSATSDFVANSSARSRSFYGPATNVMLAMGGTLKKSGVILGGAVSRQWVHSLSGTDENDNEMDLGDVSFAMMSIGFLCDVYFAQDGGWHALGILGLSAMEVDRPTVNDVDSPSGEFLLVGAGYDWWVADRLQLGVLGQLGYHMLEVTETGTSSTDVTVLSPGLALSLVVN